MVSKTRAQRIAERIREDLSEILVQEASDPRLAGVFVTSVEVDRELAFAKVYVSALEGSERRDELLAGLRHAHGFLRSQLAARMELRTFPRLRFIWDPTYERAEKIERLIDQLHQEEASRESQASETGAFDDDELEDEEFGVGETDEAEPDYEDDEQNDEDDDLEDEPLNG